MSGAARGLKRLRSGLPELTPLFTRASRAARGVILYEFGPLLRYFGKQAGADIAIVEDACRLGLESGSTALHAAAFDAAQRLEALATLLPLGEYLAVTRALEHRTQTLLFRSEEYGKQLLKTLKRRVREAQAATSASKQATETMRRAKATFLERMHRARAAGDDIFAVFAHFKARVPVASAKMRAVFEEAASRAPEFRDALELYGKNPTPAGLSELWGYLSRVRGLLGEAYALSSDAWRLECDRLVRDTEQIVRRQITKNVNRGQRVVELRQIDHKILIDGKEGPDVMIAVLRPRSRRMVIRARGQVKAADISEGLPQSLKDDVRLVGQGDPAIVQFTIDGKPQAFVVEFDADIPESLYALNMTGSRVPGPDADDFALMGRRIDELVMDMSVDQFTHLALSVMESAMAALKASP